ncbi:MAG: LacI family transcriptional regulator [Propionibacteriaceae bacterium]|jgi:DNA-binding LacI/PurR family transcriptional regulator|nr:LacI family transcriptional regulator [Propionibacteriaceae bacterium]
MAVTMRDVADLAQVSVKSVSNVVNGYEHVSPALRGRVEAALDALGYRLNVSARNLRTQRTGMITLAVPELALSYFAELAGSVIRSAEEHGWTVLIEQTGSEREREIEVLSGSRRRVSDGVLFSPSESWPSQGQAFSIDFPLVVLGEQMFDVAADYVTMDNVAASRAATAHLIGLGRRHIAALGAHANAVQSTAARRLAGHRQALAEAGLGEDPALFVPANPWHRLTGAQAMVGLLDSGVEIDAVFAFNDALALGALHVLNRRGVKVPDDVAIIGFDDIDDVRYSLPTISSVDPGRDRLAQAAVERLLARIAGQHAGQFHRITTDSRVIGRQSTGDTTSPDDQRTVSVQPGRVEDITPVLAKQ